MTPHNPAMVHPTSMCLPWTKNMLWNPNVNIVPKHKATQQKIKNQCTTYRNARSSCGTSFTMKHDGFQFDICKKSFAHKAFNHSNKSSHVCQFVITQAISTLMRWKSNTINVNKWYFTLLLPNVASIKISPLWLNWNMAWNISVWIPMVKGTWISFTYLHLGNKKTSSRWAGEKKLLVNGFMDFAKRFEKIIIMPWHGWWVTILLNNDPDHVLPTLINHLHWMPTISPVTSLHCHFTLPSVAPIVSIDESLVRCNLLT
jgi:hypothetical protein